MISSDNGYVKEMYVSYYLFSVSEGMPALIRIINSDNGNIKEMYVSYNCSLSQSVCQL